MTWDPHTHPIDYFTASGDRSPGLAHVAGKGPKRGWDERRGYGISGSVLFFTGEGLAVFSVVLLLVSAEDWAAWHAWKHHVARVPDNRYPKAIDVWHPYLDEINVHSAVVEQVGMPQELEDGSHTITIEFKQHRRPKLRLAKPEASKGKEPTDPYDQQIAALTSQVQELAE